MKNKVYLVLVMFLLVLTCFTLTKASVLDISLEQDPYPAQIGQSLELSFQVENTGTENLTVTFDLDVDTPLTLISNNEKILTIDAGETKTITYDVRVDGDAQEGQEQVTLNYEINGHDYDEDFDVTIAPQQVYLQVISVTSVPEKVAPGQELVLNIKIKNTANSEIRDVILSLNLSEMPFAPQSVTEQRIDSLGSQEEQQISFNLIALPSAQVQIYKVPLEIQYNDEFGQSYSREDLVSVNVFEEPSIEVSVDSNKLILGMSSKISIKVLNKGLGEVNFAELRVLPSPDYSISQDYEYLGNIASDDYNSVDFTLTPKKQDMTLNLILEYRDSNNQKYSETKTLDVKAYTLAEAQQAGLLPAFPWFVIIIVLVVIALIVYFFVRRRRKKKKLMQSQG